MMRDERASLPAFTMQAMLASPRRPHPYERALQPRCLTLTSSDLVRCNKLDTSPVADAVLVARLFVLLQLRVDPCIFCGTDGRGIGRQRTATDVPVSKRGRRRGHTVPAQSGGFAFVNSVVAVGTQPIHR
jgi:hypothetical protein